MVLAPCRGNNRRGMAFMLPSSSVRICALLADQLDRHFDGAGDVESFHAGLDLPEGDDAGTRNRLAVAAIVDRDVRAGGPVDDLPDFVGEFPLASPRNRPRQVGVFLSPEQVVHLERHRQE